MRLFNRQLKLYREIKGRKAETRASRVGRTGRDDMQRSNDIFKRFQSLNLGLVILFLLNIIANDSFRTLVGLVWIIHLVGTTHQRVFNPDDSDIVFNRKCYTGDY